MAMAFASCVSNSFQVVLLYKVVLLSLGGLFTKLHTLTAGMIRDTHSCSADAATGTQCKTKRIYSHLGSEIGI